MTVAASTQNLTGRYSDCDEYGDGLVTFEDGTLGSIAASWIDRHAPFSVDIVGSAGYARLEAGVLHYRSERVEGADGTRPWTALPDPLPHAFELFLDAIAGSRDVPLVTPGEAADRVAVMEALYQSATGDAGRLHRFRERKTSFLLLGAPGITLTARRNSPHFG